MRNFIRHPSSIPVDFHLEELVTEGGEHLKDVSFGGLSFSSKLELSVGDIIRIKIPVIMPVFQAMGRVSWCHPEGSGFDIGIEFLNKDDMFSARMVEQVCHIEQYKQEALLTEGRKLSSEDAALEWIKKYAPHFPLPDENPD
jgi:hypothetical protein